MRSIARLFSAFGTLADSILALAGVLDAARTRLQEQLALEDAPPVVLDHHPAKENGTGKRHKAKTV